MSAADLILAKARAIISENPRPFYCATGCRFGTCPKRCFDCSGFTYVCYQAAGIKIGADTGAIARDVAAGKASFAPLAQARPAALLMRRSGSRYDGGPDEHVGLYVDQGGGQITSYESAGSKNGVGLYRRSASFWREVVHYPQLSGSSPEVPDLLADERQELFLARQAADNATRTAQQAIQKVDALRAEILPVVQKASAESESAKNYAVRIDRLLTEYINKHP